MFQRALIVTLVAGLLSVAASVSQAGGVDEFNAFLLPELSAVEIGDTVMVTFEVDETAQQFNAYEVTLQWDPAVVELLSVSEGSLFTSNCGNRFFQQVGAATDSTITYSHVLLCNGVSVDGPGVLSTWEFRAVADGSSDVLLASDPDRTFFDAGLFVWPSHPTYPRQVIFHNAVIEVGDVTNVEQIPPALSQELGLRLVPNPVTADSQIWFRLGSVGSSEIRFEIIDPAGRRVREWSQSARSVDGWQQADNVRKELPRGTYILRGRSADEVSSLKFQVVR